MQHIRPYRSVYAWSIAISLIMLLLVHHPLLVPDVSSSPSLTMGVNMHPLQDIYAPEQASQHIALAQTTGATMVRIDIHWAWMEPTQPGIAHWNTEQLRLLDEFIAALDGTSIDVLATVLDTPCWASSDPNKHCPSHQFDYRYPPTDPQDYATFLEALVQRYHGRIRAWEVWNEPNMHSFWANPDPVRYTALLKAAYPAVKASDPTALVIGGSLAPSDGAPTNPTLATTYLEGMYQAGARGFFDRLAYHPYTDGNTPTWYDARWPTHSYRQSVPAMHDVMQRYGDSSPIWITEIGWTTVSDACLETDCWTAILPTSEADQAAYLAETVQLARSWDFVEAWFWYELTDTIRPADPDYVSFQHHFGLFRADYQPKPAAAQFRSLALSHTQYLPLIRQ
jgi:hypothetical protein